MSVTVGVPAPQTLLSRTVCALSTSAPFAVPVHRPGRRAVHLTSGSPAPEALPLAELAQAHAAALGQQAGVASLQYSDSPGLPRLRTALAAREGVDVARIVITNGALHGVQLALQAVLEPGDVVILDDPVFPDTRRIVEAAGGVPVPVPVDPDGIDVQAIEELLRGGTRPKAVYTVPDFHNPSGHTLSAERRARLVELAARYRFLVVSDNPYRLTRLQGEDVPDLTDTGAHVVRVSTFSKTLGPGLRLGWVVAPDWLAPHLVNLRRRVDFHSSTLTQHVVADLLERPGWFDDLAATGREVYRRRAALLVGSLRRHVPDLLEFTDPQGGFFVWARVTDERVAPTQLVAAAAEAGLVFAPGSAFAPTPSSAAHAYVRLAYSTADLDDLATAGAVLAEAADGVRARQEANR